MQFKSAMTTMTLALTCILVPVPKVDADRAPRLIVPSKNRIGNANLSVVAVVTKGVTIAANQPFQLTKKGVAVKNKTGNSKHLGTVTITANGQLTNPYTGISQNTGPVLGMDTSEILFTPEVTDQSNVLIVNNQSLISNTGVDGLLLGMAVYRQSVPAGGSMATSGVVGQADTNSQQALSIVAASAASGFEPVGIRDEFKYVPDRLRFENQRRPDVKGQVGMNVAPATGSGTSRYVPLGEF